MSREIGLETGRHNSWILANGLHFLKRFRSSYAFDLGPKHAQEEAQTTDADKLVAWSTRPALITGSRETKRPNRPRSEKLGKTETHFPFRVQKTRPRHASLSIPYSWADLNINIRRRVWPVPVESQYRVPCSGSFPPSLFYFYFALLQQQHLLWFLVTCRHVQPQMLIFPAHMIDRERPKLRNKHMKLKFLFH